MVSGINFVVHPSVEGFWAFCLERQLAYRRKEGIDPWAWTDGPYSLDPAIARHHFCNVYREIDKGTKFFRTRVTADDGRPAGGSGLPLQEFLFQAIAYRLVNRREVFEIWSPRFLPRSTEAGQWLDFLQARVDGGLKVFTGRHLNTGFKKYSALIGSLSPAVLGGMAIEIWNAGRMSDAIEPILGLKGIGKFFGWQVLCDLLEDGRLDHVADRDDWVHMGPGAINAIREIYPEATASTAARYALKLRDEQELYTAAFDLSTVAPPEAPGWMRVKNVEHALCEYARYTRACRMGARGAVGLEVKPWAR